LIGKIQFPSHFDPAAKDLIKKLLTADRTRRLGNLKNGAEDVKRHKFFKGIDWHNITNPNNPTPIVPEVTFEGDTQNFEVYPEPSEDEETAPATSSSEDYKDLFADF
jgi:serine/threonine protein kinase